MKYINVVLGILLLGLLAACSSDDSVLEPGAPSADTSIDYTDVEKEVAREMAHFDYSFFKSVCKEGDGNVVISPLSMQMLLGMTALAVDEVSADEIVRGVGCADLKDLKSFHGKTLKRFAAVDKNVDVALANAMWHSQTLSPDMAFSREFFETYDGSIFPMDFDSPQSVESVNQWCREKTRGLIPNMIGSFPPNVDLVMANALYFSGKWINPFDEKETSESIFHGSCGETSIKMMHCMGLQNYWVGKDYEAVMIDMGNGDYTATFVLPDCDKDLNDLVDELDYVSLMSCPRLARNVDLYLPKCKLQSDGKDVSHVLADLGIKRIFDGGYMTVFDLIYGGVQFFQKSAVEFGEKGSEGASVSWSFWPSEGSGPDDSEIKVPVVEFNRPYLFFINERNTGMCVLCGRIENLD